MYLIRERFFRSDEHSNITDDQGRPVLQVDAKALSLRNRLVLRDPKGKGGRSSPPHAGCAPA